MQQCGIVVFGVGIYPAYCLTCFYLAAYFYIYLAQVGVYGEVVSVAYYYGTVVSGHNEDFRYYSVEYAPCFGSGKCLYYYAAVVYLYVF